MKSAVEDSVRRLTDRLDLLELPGRYARAVDDRDIETLVGLYCEDGEYGFPDGTRVTGHADLARFYADTLATCAMSIHSPHAHVITQLDGNEATGWVNSHTELSADGQYVVVAVRYEDAYRRVDGVWRFARRTVWMWYAGVATDLPELMGTTDRKRFRTEPKPADLPESLASYAAFLAAGND